MVDAPVYNCHSDAERIVGNSASEEFVNDQAHELESDSSEDSEVEYEKQGAARIARNKVVLAAIVGRAVAELQSEVVRKPVSRRQKDPRAPPAVPARQQPGRLVRDTAGKRAAKRKPSQVRWRHTCITALHRCRC